MKIGQRFDFTGVTKFITPKFEKQLLENPLLNGAQASDRAGTSLNPYIQGLSGSNNTFPFVKKQPTPTPQPVKPKVPEEFNRALAVAEIEYQNFLDKIERLNLKTLAKPAYGKAFADAIFGDVQKLQGGQGLQALKSTFETFETVQVDINKFFSIS